MKCKKFTRPGGVGVNTKKVVYLFYTTLIIGTVAGGLIGFILDWRIHFRDMAEGLFGGIILIFITAAIWTVIAQMGFFAYLMIHRFGLGIFRSAKLWNKVQVVIIAFILFDLMFFRHLLFAGNGESILSYAIIPVCLLIYGLIVALIKSKETNMLAFVPTIFLMVVVTTIEWIPALRENDTIYMMNAIVPLLVANTWQVLILHRLHGKEMDSKQPLSKKILKESNPQTF